MARRSTPVSRSAACCRCRRTFWRSTSGGAPASPPAGDPGQAQRGLQGDRQGQGRQGRQARRQADEGGRRPQGADPGGRGGGARADLGHPECAGAAAQHAAGRRARRRGCRRQRAGAHLGHSRQARVQAQAAFRDRRRPRISWISRRRPRSRARASSSCAARWPSSSARSPSSCSTCTRANSATKRSRRPIWCATTPCSARPNCRSSPRTSTRPRTACG